MTKHKIIRERSCKCHKTKITIVPPKTKQEFIKMYYTNSCRGLLEETVLEKVEEIRKRLNDLKDFLEDVFLTTEECTLIKETDEIVKNKRFNELKPLDEV